MKQCSGLCEKFLQPHVNRGWDQQLEQLKTPAVYKEMHHWRDFMSNYKKGSFNTKAWSAHSYVSAIGEIDWPVVSSCLKKNDKLACCDRKEEQQEEHAEPVADFGEVMAVLQVLFQINKRIRILL
jgi:hypothetical protein